MMSACMSTSKRSSQSKPTDLWGGFPPSLILKAPCKNGDPCHVAAPRGSSTGIQGNGQVFGLRDPKEGLDEDAEHHRRNRRGNLTAHKRQHRQTFGTADKHTLAAMRAKIPYQLSEAVCLAAEADDQAGRRPAIQTLF
jgi:hypothetical protein